MASATETYAGSTATELACRSTPEVASVAGSNATIICGSVGVPTSATTLPCPTRSVPISVYGASTSPTMLPGVT
jgi:hypothetical protein